ncbi:hypothetical protein DAD99_17310 [Pseudarthrobacter sp. AB1]|nr:hypothetical protein [Pseudarthrobacter sp. AB1]
MLTDNFITGVTVAAASLWSFSCSQTQIHSRHHRHNC